MSDDTITIQRNITVTEATIPGDGAIDTPEEISAVMGQIEDLVASGQGTFDDYEILSHGVRLTYEQLCEMLPPSEVGGTARLFVPESGATAEGTVIEWARVVPPEWGGGYYRNDPVRVAIRVDRPMTVTFNLGEPPQTIERHLEAGTNIVTLAEHGHELIAGRHEATFSVQVSTDGEAYFPIQEITVRERYGRAETPASTGIRGSAF